MKTKDDAWLVSYPAYKPIRWTLFDSEVGDFEHEEVKKLPDEYILDMLCANSAQLFGELTESRLDEVARDTSVPFNIEPSDIVQFYQLMPGSVTIAELYTRSGVSLGVGELDIDYLEDRIKRAIYLQLDIVDVTERDKRRYTKGTLQVKDAEALMRRQEKYNRFFGIDIVSPLGEYGGDG